MSNKFFFVLVCILFLSSGVFALSWNVCIDKQSPEAPSGLSVSGNVVLSWSEAVDLPESSSECTFGIDYYNVYLDGELIGSSSELGYSGDVLSDGIYIFEVSAVDKAGNEGLRAIVEVVFPLSVDNPNPVDNPGSPGGGGSSSSGGGSSGITTVDDVDDNSSSVDDGESNEVDLGFSSADTGDDDGSFSGITGAVIGGGNGSWIAVLIFVVLVLVVFFFARKKEK